MFEEIVDSIPYHVFDLNRVKGIKLCLVWIRNALILLKEDVKYENIHNLYSFQNQPSAKQQYSIFMGNIVKIYIFDFGGMN